MYVKMTIYDTHYTLYTVCILYIVHFHIHVYLDLSWQWVFALCNCCFKLSYYNEYKSYLRQRADDNNENVSRNLSVPIA